MSSETHAGNPGKNVRLPKSNARNQYLPKARSTTRERGNDFRGWAIYTDGCTRVVDGETPAGWGVIARSLHGKIDIVFRPVVTTEAHLAFSDARAHSNNTAEMTAMIGALSFLGPRGLVARDARLQTCSWCLLGHDPSSLACPASTCVSAVDAERTAWARQY